MDKDKELYKILGVSEDASAEEIRKAYKQKAMTYHPDKTQGDQEKEEHFKKVTNAFSILSDPKKKEMYDRFGVTDENQVGSGGGMNGGFDDVFKGMFGGMSYVFNNGGGGMPFEMFGNMFGGGGEQINRIDVPITLAEVYNGTNKKIEFEIMDVCNTCKGCGATDPSHVIKCMICKGSGTIQHSLNPFMVTMLICDACSGHGTSVKNGMFCQTCKGEKTQYVKKSYEIGIPKGIPNGNEVKINNKGSWNAKAKQYGHIVFRFLYKIPPNVQLDGLDVHHRIDINVSELLCGFEREVQMYGEKQLIVSEYYFNPSKPYVITGKGLPDPRHSKRYGNYIFDFNVVYEDNSKLQKYPEVFQKILKMKAIETPTDKNVISLNK